MRLAPPQQLSRSSPSRAQTTGARPAAPLHRTARPELLPPLLRRRHLHLRDGPSLASVVPFTARVFGRAVVMPNLKPPVRNLADATAYRQRVLAAVPAGAAFEPLMTLYLTGASRARIPAPRR